MGWITAADVNLIIDNQVRLGQMMTVLQTAISTLQASVNAFAAAQTAAQQQQFSAADVANINAINTQVQALAAALTPAPTPTPTPAPSTGS